YFHAGCGIGLYWSAACVSQRLARCASGRSNTPVNGRRKREAMTPRVGILMGSDSDLEIMEEAARACEEFGVVCEMHVLSAHRTPHDTADYAKTAHGRELKVLIAGAGGAAHLAGVVAAHTPLPVIGVPIKSKALQGHDSLLSMVQMPSGVRVATVAIHV